jgi:type II secretory pathway component PulF
MPYFNYKAYVNSTDTVTGLVEAPSADAAARLLREKQLFVIDVSEAKNKIQLSALTARFKRAGFGDVVNFTQQLSTMVVAGLQLPEALSILAGQSDNPAFAQVLEDIEHQIVGGSNLGDALEKYPKYFSTVYIALIRAGESSGMLEQVLVKLAESLESQQEFRSKVKGAMIYPVIIVIAMAAVITVMMTVVIPKLTDMYKDFGASLPWTTQLLMNISGFFVKFWWLMIAVIVGATVFFNRWKKTAIGEFTIDTLILKVPIWGNLQRKVILVDFTRTLGMLVGSGVHILDALRVLKDTLGNIIFRNAVHEIAEKVEKGFPLGETFAQHEVFPPIVSQMIKVGEETGKLDETLTKLSKYFQTESEQLVKGLTTAIEPVIMVVLGLGVGFIVISVITPIYNLTSSFK